MQETRTRGRTDTVTKGNAKELTAKTEANSDWLSAYKEKNRIIFDARPLKKSKYTSISRLEELLISEKGPQVKILTKVGKAHGPMTLKKALSEMPEKIALILSKEERAKDQFEAYINANFDENAECVVIIPMGCAEVTLEIELPQGSCAKYFIIAEKGADVNIIEKIKAKGSALANETVYAEGNQTIKLTKIYLESKNLISCQQCILGKDARLVNGNAWLAGSFVRTNTCNILDGQGSAVEDYSLLLASGTEHYDINYSSVHRAKDTFSHNIFNSALKDNSRAVYDGMIRIEEGGARANALLETHSMILGSGASSNQIPQLEIKTDEVKATHSATVAHIEEEELFYLQAKGIQREEAQRMVVKGFLESIVLKLPQGAREEIIARIDKKL